MTFDRTQRYDQQVEEQPEEEVPWSPVNPSPRQAPANREAIRNIGSLADIAVQEVRARLTKPSPINRFGQWVAPIPALSPGAGGGQPYVPNLTVQALRGAYLMNEFFYTPADAAAAAKTWDVVYGRDFAANPDLMALAHKSGAAAFAAFELDDFFTEVTNFGPGDLAQQLNSAGQEQLAEWDLLLRTEARRLRSEDATTVMLGDLTSEVLAQVPGLEDAAGVARAGVRLSEDAPDSEGAAAALFLVSRVTGLPMTSQKTGNSLIASFETENDGAFTYNVRLDGEIGDTPLDVIVAITQALWGTKHKIINADTLPGRQHLLGNFWEAATDILGPGARAFDRVDVVFNKFFDTLIPGGDDIGFLETPAQEMNRKHEAVINAAFHNAQIDADHLTILAVSAAAGDGGVTLDHVNAATLVYGSMSEEEKDAIAFNASPTEAQVEASLEGLLDDRHSIERFMDSSTEAFAFVADYWLRFAQMNILTAVDFAADLGEGILEVTGVMEPSTTHEEGRNLFFSAFDWEAGSAGWRGDTTIAEYLEVPEPFVGITNLIGTLAGDPFSWIMLGGAQRAAHVTELMSTEAGNLTWMRTQGVSLVNRWNRGLGRGPIGQLGVQLEAQLPPHQVLRLLRGESLEDVMLAAMKDDLWVPALGAGNKLRDISSNVGRMASLGDSGMAEFLRRYLTQWPTGRQVRFSSGNFYEDMMNQMTMMSTAVRKGATGPAYPAAELADDFLRLTELVDNTSIAGRINAVNVQHLQAQRRGLATQAQELGHRRTWQLARDIPKMEDDIARAVAAGDTAAADAARARIPQEVLDEFPQRLAAAEDWTERWLSNKSDLAAAQHLDNTLAVNRSRAAYQDFYEEWWDRMLTRLDVPRNANGTPRWSEITGNAADDVATPPLAEQVAQITGVDDVPILTRPTSIRQPVSPAQLVAWHARHSDSWWTEHMVRMFLAPNTRPSRISRFLQMNRKWMTGNVLWNPFAYLRSNIEEPIRDVLLRGFRGRASRVEGVADVPGAVSRGASRIAAGPRELLRREQPIPAGAAGHVAAPSGPVTNIGSQGTQFVVRGKSLIGKKGEYVEYAADATAGRAETAKAANSLFSGVFADQPMMTEWAASQLADDFTQWTRFFDDGGGKGLVDDVIRAGGVKTPMTALEAYNSYERMMEAFLGQVPEASQPAARTAVLKAMAFGEELPEAIARQFKIMPAFDTAEGGAFNRVMQIVFGKPGEVHSSLVWHDFYEQTRYILQRRHGDRIFTPESFAAQFDNMTVEQAKGHMWRMSDDAVEVAAREGMFLPRQVHAAAARVATAHAEHMAYKMGASSLFGQKMGKAWVFLKAQTDFMGYYGRELMSGSVMGLHPKFRSMLNRLLSPTGKQIPDARFLARLPLNVRLGARMMDYFGTLTTFESDVEDAIKNDRDPLQVIMDRFTFVPTEFNENIYMQFEPGLDPFPAWALHFLPTHAGDDDSMLAKIGAAFRDAMSAGMPAFDFFEGESVWNPTDLENGPGAFTFGDSVASGRRLFDVGTKAAASFIDSNFGTDFVQRLSGMLGTPPGFATDLRIRTAQAVAENPNMFANSEGDDENYTSLEEQIIRESYTIASRDGVHDYGRALLEKSGFNIDRDDGQYLELYEPMVTDGAIERLRDLGLIDERQYDEITELWEKYVTVPDPRTQRYDQQIRETREGIGSAVLDFNTGQEGITRTEATRLADELSEVLFGNGDLMQAYLTVKYPQLVGNSVSGSKVTENAPIEYRDGDGLVVRPAQSGRDLREQGRQELWIVDRDPEEIILAMFQQNGNATRTLANELWFQATRLKTRSKESADGRTTRIGSIEAEPPTINNPLPGSVIAAALGIEPGTYTFEQLYDKIEELHGVAMDNYQPYGGSITERKLGNSVFADQLKELRDEVKEKGYNPSDPRDWEEEDRNKGRVILQQAAINPGVPLTPEDFARFLSPYWGEMTPKIIKPPVLEEVRMGEDKDAGTFRMSVDARDLVVLDGDTVSWEVDPTGRLGKQMAEAVAGVPSFTRTSDSAQPIRLLGVNAHEEYAVDIERGDSRYADQSLALRRLLDRAGTVEFVVFDAETFGTFQTNVEGEDRWIMVMYLPDGRAVWDETIFTSVNVRGAGLGGEGVTNIPWVADYLKEAS